MAISLPDILKVKQDEVNAARALVPLSALRDKITGLPPCRDFYRTIAAPAPRGINVIAEIKKASPSAGLIRPHFDPVALADEYRRAGADALSILTDETFFQGHLDYISSVKERVDLPILRKDFIIDPYQIYQARLAGADAVLLIAEALETAQLIDLLHLAASLSLTTLLEIHEKESLLTVQDSIEDFSQYRCLLGINNRNLKTMQVDISHSLELLSHVQEATPVISESGIKTREHVQHLRQAGFHAVLIGETLMRRGDLATAFAELFD